MCSYIERITAGRQTLVKIRLQGKYFTIPPPHSNLIKLAKVSKKNPTFYYQNWMNKKPRLKSSRNLTSLLSSLVGGELGLKLRSPSLPDMTPSSHVRLCNPTDCSTPGFPVLHYLPEFARNHILQVGDTIQPSRSLSSPSLLLPLSFLAPGSSLMSRLFTSDGQSIRASASVLPMNIQGWFPLGLTGLIPRSPRDSPESQVSLDCTKDATAT